MIDLAWERLSKVQKATEYYRCKGDWSYWVRKYVYIYDKVTRRWIPFDLWPAQLKLGVLMRQNRFLIALKARQVGFTWVALSVILHSFIFHPSIHALFYSKTDKEARELLWFRFKGMYNRLPSWQRHRTVIRSSNSDFQIGNGSRVTAMSTEGGRSYAATHFLIDEADYIKNIKNVMLSAEPVVEESGHLWMISTADKSLPQSMFKRMYKAAKMGAVEEGDLEYLPFFTPWWAHPRRDAKWYLAMKRRLYRRDGNYDALHSEFPSNDAEALSPQQHGKRLRADFVREVYIETDPIQADFGIAGLRVYREPVPGLQYVLGSDTAEGLPDSDDSTVQVLEYLSGKQAAVLQGKIDPRTLGANIWGISQFYNDAPVLVERNNHGHATIGWLDDNTDVELLCYSDDRHGWISSTKGKVLMYSSAASAIGDHAVEIYDASTFYQLTAIEKGTLRAPKGELDDLADAYTLACCAMEMEIGGGEVGVAMAGSDAI